MPRTPLHPLLVEEDTLCVETLEEDSPELIYYEFPSATNAMRNLCTWTAPGVEELSHSDPTVTVDD